MRSCHSSAPLCTSTPMPHPSTYTNEDGLIDLLRVFEGSQFVLVESCANGWDRDNPTTSKHLRPFPCDGVSR